MDRGLSVVLADLLNQAREVWRIDQIFRLIVLLFLLPERMSAGEANVEAARKCYLAAGLDEMWRMTAAEIRRDHYRKYGFMPGFEVIVAGKRALPQPSFLDMARAQWASKGR